MPNWCNNNLNISGDYESLKKFADTVRTTDENGNARYDILGTLYPIPQELKETVALAVLSAQPETPGT